MLSANYVVGLVDGEGSFFVYVKNVDENKERVRQVRIEPKFCLKLVEVDKQILYGLQRLFNCGHIYYQKDSRLNHRDCYRFEMTNRQDLAEKIIPFFKENNLKLKTKSKDFKIFCKIVKRIIRNEHLTKAGVENLHQLKQQMH